MTVSVSVEPHAAVPASRSGAFSHFWLLEWGAGVFALALVLTSMLLFVMNTVAIGSIRSSPNPTPTR